MIVQATSASNERVRYPGIDVVTESGSRALLDLQDQNPAVESIEGDATGTVENLIVVTDELGTGHKLDAVLRPGTSGTANLLRLVADADSDAGETRPITLDISYVVKAEEAAGFNVPAPVIEPING